MNTLRNKFVVGPVTALTVLASTTGCSQAESLLASVNPPDISRCYDTPQPAPVDATPTVKAPQIPPIPDTSSITDSKILLQKLDDYNKAMQDYEQQFSAYESVSSFTGPAITIPIDAYGFAKGDPLRATSSVAKTITAGLVKVVNSGNDSYGTGFAVSSPSGETEIITAAHVVTGTPLKNIQIVTDSNKTSSVSNGCFIYENHGTFADPSIDEIVDTDIAVLKLTDTRTVTPLAIASQPPSKGDCVSLINYQRDAGPGYPADYSALVAGKTGTHALQLLTGTQEMSMPATNLLFDSIHLVPGASGGPVVNQAGQVVGVSTSSTRDGSYLSVENIKTAYNINFTGAHDENKTGGFEVTSGSAMPLSTILLAMNTPLSH
jgi:S1-C subfamily serine protease